MCETRARGLSKRGERERERERSAADDIFLSILREHGIEPF